jgi:hypothetical protein
VELSRRLWAKRLIEYQPYACPWSSKRNGRTQRSAYCESVIDNAPLRSVACEGMKHDFPRQRAFSSAISCANLPIFTKQPTPDPSSAWHPWIGTSFRVHGVFYRNLTAWSSDWYMDADIAHRGAVRGAEEERLNHQAVSFKSPADTPAMPGMLRKSTAFVPRHHKFESISLQQRVVRTPVP